MKTSVIICEFNPLHSGHKRILDFAKTFSDKVVCVMSGNFVQRGMPACAEKHKRALHALKAGADLVVELPVIYAVSSAENFALGGVKIANMLNADFLVFGSESNDLNGLQKCLEQTEDAKINAEIRKNLTLGMSYPKAVFCACGNDLLQKPNNILAVEYLRALKQTHSKIIPKTILREDNFNGGETQNFSSSTALRADNSLLKKYSFDFVIPDICCETEEKYKNFATLFLSTLTVEQMRNICGVNEGLENRIFAADKTRGFEKMTEEIKTARYTRAKLQRIFFNCILGITKEDEKKAKIQTPQTKVLGVAKNSVRLLESLNNNSDSITEKADRFYESLSGEHALKKLTVW